ncbi:MAG: lipoprotein-releasing ABC transporter permease subunit [Pseudomonadales bacterium]|nr:lipoprotein-releasing ABC transporter permease subunit [Pseudomonadales bacterium]
MRHSLSNAIALRYVSVGKRSQLVSFMSWLTISGLVLGITILLTVLSVMNGFDKELRENILGIVPHATVKSYQAQNLEQWQALTPLLTANPAISAVAPVIESIGVVSTPQTRQQQLTSASRYSKSILVNGMNPQDMLTLSTLDEFMLSGKVEDLASSRFNVILGKTLADNLGVDVGGKVSLYSLDVSINPIRPMPTQRQFTVVGIFRVGTLELDSATALITLQDAQALYRYGDSYSGLRLKTGDVLQVNRLRQDLMQVLPAGFYMESWTQLFGAIYENIRLSRTIVGLLLWLLVCVAAFNLVVSLIMIVRDKRGDIAILRTMGASPALIARIFVTQGLLVGMIGLLAGLAAGILFSLTISDLMQWLELALGFELLSAEVYPVDFLPSELRLTDVLSVSAGVFFLCFLASIYPAWRAARVHPAEALRFE